MTVAELIDMLKAAHPEAKVVATDLYGESTFVVNSMVYNLNEVELTGEKD